MRFFTTIIIYLSIVFMNKVLFALLFIGSLLAACQNDAKQSHNTHGKLNANTQKKVLLGDSSKRALRAELNDPQKRAMEMARFYCNCKDETCKSTAQRTSEAIAKTFKTDAVKQQEYRANFDHYIKNCATLPAQAIQK